MEAILANGLNWLTKHVPGVALLCLLMIFFFWMGATVTNFNNRLTETERICTDINTRQLPEIRTEIKELKTDVTAIKVDITEMKRDIIEMKLLIKKIDTYLSTKDKDYPK